MTHTPTDQQSAIISAAASGSPIICSAGAGCSKTSTIEMFVPRLSAPATAVAFNTSIKKELEQRLPPTTTCRTANGLGHRAWQKVVRPKLTVNADKCGDILKLFLQDSGLPFEETQTLFGDVVKLVALAKHTGIVPKGHPYRGLEPDEPETWEDLADRFWIEPSSLVLQYSHRVLEESIRQAYQGLIDFDDQIYMPTLFGASYDRAKILIVDEAQDLSPINHLQLFRCAPEQLIAVGDPRQAIYAFRGADSNSMANIERQFKKLNFSHFPLSLTFRCPKLVVKRQLDHYPEFEAFKTNPEGKVLRWTDWSSLQLPQDNVAILCRNNGPILSLAFKLLRNKVPIKVLGRDIAKSLKNLLKKALRPGGSTTEDLLRQIETWKQEELQKAAGRQGRMTQIHDRAESMSAICENVLSLEEACAAVDNIFSREGRVVLSTGHKAKGLEWETVIHLDPWRIPSKQAVEANALGDSSMLRQENNLRYVIETRSRQTLIMANLEDFND